MGSPILNMLSLFLLLNFSQNVVALDDDSVREAYALLKWKTTFQNQNSPLFSPWTFFPENATNVSSCVWFGISCDYPGRIISINLNTFELIGMGFGGETAQTQEVPHYVVSMPGSLLQAVDSTHAYSIRKMMAVEALARRLFSSETMGSATLSLNQVRMVTGNSARAIALECDKLASEADATEPDIIEKKSFPALSVTHREEIAENNLVMGRLSPFDRLLLVQATRQRGHAVAVTGDGTNDAPALHEVTNVGINTECGLLIASISEDSGEETPLQVPLIGVATFMGIVGRSLVVVLLARYFPSQMKVRRLSACETMGSATTIYSDKTVTLSLNQVMRWIVVACVDISKFISFQLIITVLFTNIVAAISSSDVPPNEQVNFNGTRQVQSDPNTFQHN